MSIKSIRKLFQRYRGAFREPASTHRQIVSALDDILAQPTHVARNAVVLVAQIDAFHALNRQHTGDQINQISTTLERRMKGGLLKRDMVRQLDGGQFAVILSPLFARTADDVMILTGQVQDLLSAPITVGPLRAKVTVSIGCALAQTEALKSGSDMLEAARIAQMDASASGLGGLRFYVAQMGQQVAQRRRFRQDIHTALISGHIVPYFQPQISLLTKKLSGIEVLARWQHTERGVIPPGVFLPLLEDAGLMRQLGHRMLDSALHALTVWDHKGLNVPHISINMCAEELAHPDIVPDVKTALRKYDIAPSRLVIEVLETVHATGESDPITRNLARLSDLGCCIDLDDFGTGHASIKSMHNFFVNRIKIDRSYITNVDHSEDQQQVVGTILSMAQHMHVDTVAEGVETDAEFDHLIAAGCGHAQGFLIAKPLPEDHLMAWTQSYFQANPEAAIGQAVH